MDLSKYIKDIPDFPKQGIIFKDICPLLNDAAAVDYAATLFAEAVKDKNITKVVGIESRGFLLGILIAQKLGVGFIPIRKPGKLPGEVLAKSYSLEYGEDCVEMQSDCLTAEDNVLLHDDVLATGGTAKAACELIETVGAKVAQVSFLMELKFLKGSEKLQNRSIHSLLEY